MERKRDKKAEIKTQEKQEQILQSEEILKGKQAELEEAEKPAKNPFPSINDKTLAVDLHEYLQIKKQEEKKRNESFSKESQIRSNVKEKFMIYLALGLVELS